MPLGAAGDSGKEPCKVPHHPTVEMSSCKKQDVVELQFHGKFCKTPEWAIGRCCVRKKDIETSHPSVLSLLYSEKLVQRKGSSYGSSP